MKASLSVRVARILRFVLPAILLTGCFGEGDGPDRILGTPAPPPPPLPAGFCDPVNFEDVCPAPGIANFAGGATTIVDHNSIFVGGNPVQGGINTSDQVAQMQKFADQPFGGTTLTPVTPVTFGAGEAWTMKVWSPRSVPVLFKFEGLDKERSVSHTGSGSWEELCFDFTGDTAGPAVTGITVIFDLGVNGAAATDPGNWTFFYDDITQVSSCPGAGPTMWSEITFDDPGITYGLTGFGGAENSTIVADPTDAGNQVVQVVRAAGAETFAGTTVSTGLNNSVPVIPLDTASPQMTVRVFSPAIGVPVRLKIEDANDDTVFVETEALTTAANAWEELTFNFASQAAGTPAYDSTATYNKITIFFNFGASGVPEATYLFDDIDIVGGGGPGPAAFSTVTFDDSALTYTLRGFGGAEDSTVVVDPTDSGNNVVQVNRSAAAETFAGTVVSTGPNESIGVIPLDASNTTMSVRVWAPAAGIPVRLKVENSANDMISVETEATTTVAMDWETLTFDFTNQAAGTTAFDPAATYDKVVVFFNFGTDGATAGAQTFYFDDIDVGSGATVVAPSQDFESGSATFLDFEGGVAAVIANPDVSGLNTSSLVGQMQKGAGQPFAGSTLDLGGVAPLAAGDSYTMLVRAQRPVPVTFKIEGAGLGDERVANYGGSLGWELLCFDFTGVSGEVTGYTLIFDNGVVGDAFNSDPNVANNWIFQFDDIQQVSTCPPVDTFSAVTFDDSAVTYALRGFNGAEDSTLITDPADAGNTVVQVNRSDTAATFAGTVVSTGPNESVGKIPLDASNTTMTVRVRAPAAGIPVRLKIENSLNDQLSVETEATTTAADTWETLTFDFANEVAGAPFNPVATYDKAVIFFNFGTDGATAGAQTFLFDDIDIASAGGGGGAFVNGDFEASGGSLDGWTQTLVDNAGGTLGSISADSSGQGGRAGTVARLIVDGTAASFNDAVISQEGLGAGTITAGDTISVSFDVYGTVTQPGAAVFVEVIFLDASGSDVGGRNFLNGNDTPYFPITTWESFSGTVTAGTGFVPNPAGGPWDVSGGVTLSLKVTCGAVDGCAQDISFDNVTFTIN